MIITPDEMRAVAYRLERVVAEYGSTGNPDDRLAAAAMLNAAANRIEGLESARDYFANALQEKSTWCNEMLAAAERMRR